MEMATNMMRNRLRGVPGRKHGFTLVELMVAISVLAMIAVLGWRGLDSIGRARSALNADLDQTRGLQLAFAQMQSDASHIAEPASLGGRVTLDAQPGRLTLIRYVFADNQPSRRQVVAYRLANGMLTRRESIATRDLTALDSSWANALADTDTADTAGAQPVVLQSGVTRMAIRTWADDGNGWRAGADGAGSAVRQAGPAGAGQLGAQQALAKGIEVSLSLQDRPADLVKIFLLGAA
jgi:general secretion pathway protein J